MHMRTTLNLDDAMLADAMRLTASRFAADDACRFVRTGSITCGMRPINPFDSAEPTPPQTPVLQSRLLAAPHR